MLSFCKKYSLALSFTALAFFNQVPSNGQTNDMSSMMVPTNTFLWLAEKAAYNGKATTNGIGFNLEMENWKLNGKQHTTHCWIFICNQTSNRIFYWHDSSPFPRKDMKIDLFDTKGRPVEKTKLGKLYGNTIDIKHVAETAKARYQKWVSGQSRTTGFMPITAHYPLTSFDLDELFVPKETGEYKLHVQMPLIQRVGNDDANPELKIIWLPEVVAKIQIWAGNISQTNCIFHSQTNASP